MLEIDAAPPRLADRDRDGEAERDAAPPVLRDRDGEVEREAVLLGLGEGAGGACASAHAPATLINRTR